MRISNSNPSFRSRGSVATIWLKESRQLQLARLTLAFIVLAGFGSVFAGRANAYQHCSNLAAPSAILNLGLAVPIVESTSNGGIYEQGGCHFWVVDISVPSNSSGGPNSVPSFFINLGSGFGPNTKAACDAYADYFVVFVKHQGQTQFGSTPIAHGSRKGVWSAQKGLIARCGLKESSTYEKLSDSLNPPASGTDIYRFAGAVKIGKKWKTVNVWAKHHVVIPW